MTKMTRTTVIKYCLIGLVLATFIGGCGGTWNKESTGEYVDNTVLTTKVKTAIFNDPMLKVLQINVESFKGVVQLSGFVDSKISSDRAVEIARSIAGVQSVKNDLGAALLKQTSPLANKELQRHLKYFQTDFFKIAEQPIDIWPDFQTGISQIYTMKQIEG